MTAKPVQELARVFANRRVGAYHAVSLVCPVTARAARPGQFIEVRTGDPGLFMLRRPFSVHAVERGGPGMGSLDIVFEVVGPGTRMLAALRPHDQVDVVGPLGRSFSLPDRPEPCVLVGGGYGAAPLFFLAEELRARRCRVDFVIGAGTETRLFKAMEAKRLGQTLTITTDDGSAGTSGMVTDVLPAVFERTRARRVYACGPMPMLAAVSRVAAAAGLPCEVAVEERMGCGTGVCFSCVLPVHERPSSAEAGPFGPGGLGAPPAAGQGLTAPGAPLGAPAAGAATRMVRTCVEGPVFDGTLVAWGEAGYDPTAVPAEFAGDPDPSLELLP